MDFVLGFFCFVGFFFVCLIACLLFVVVFLFLFFVFSSDLFLVGLKMVRKACKKKQACGWAHNFLVWLPTL